MVQRLTTRVSELVRHYLPLLLALCYGLALVMPGPGQQIRGWSLPGGWPEVARPTISQLLVAVLLLLAALGVEVHRIPIVVRRPTLLLSAMAAVWLTPAAVLLVAWWVIPLILSGDASSAILVGFALVAAMPVANSAAAWTQQSRGELPWALAMVVLSIVVCPWMIPLVLKLLGLSFSEVEATALEKLTASFTGMEFVVWVLLPTAVGMLVRWLVGAERVKRHRQAVLMWSAATLLVLNYINAAYALPQMKDDFRLAWLGACVLTALALCAVGLGVSRLGGRVFNTSPATTTALDYTLTMKNTGLAIALASDVLVDQPILLLPVFTMTLVQHLFVGVLHRGALLRNAPAEKAA